MQELSQTPTQAPRLPKVAVLLCTSDKLEFLPEQLDSILAQEDVSVSLFVSHDGRKEESRAFLGSEVEKRFAVGQFRLFEGPRQGFAKNFLSLACREEVRSDYYAFSDQDDVWDKDKLKRAVFAIASEAGPALYGSRTRLVDGAGRFIGLSPLFTKTPGFQNALVQSLAGGNTMLYNNAAAELLRAFGPVSVVTHDWWLYLLVSGAGGRCVYDPVPSLEYRQHGQNLVGMNQGVFSKLKRGLQFLQGDYRHWNDAHLQALESGPRFLNPENQRILEDFTRAKTERNPIRSAMAFLRSGVYRQSFLGQVILFLGVLLKRI